jgi:DNA transformation protein and related proteins
MVASDNFAEFLREQLAPLGRVTMWRMFGKTGVFCNGLMFGVVTNVTLWERWFSTISWLTSRRSDGITSA